MTLLDETIKELLEIEPFWNICYPCVSDPKGFCCKGADVTVSTSEWQNIASRIAHMSDEDRNTLSSNIQNKQHCLFRSENKCLIHEVRPENCRYTPFQCSIDEQGTIHYHSVKISNGCCYFNPATVTVAQERRQSLLIRGGKFLLLPNGPRLTHYLCLNWLVQREPLREPGRHISEYIHQIEMTLKYRTD